VKNLKTRIAAAATILGLGGLTGLALSAGGQKASPLASKPLIRTKVIRRTVHVTKHVKPKRPVAGGSAYPGGSSAGAAAAPVVTGSSSSGAESAPVVTGSSSSGTESAPVVTSSSGSGGGSAPVVTSTSGGGAGGGETEHEGGDGGGD
jgi:hypothetical protein